MSKANAMSFAAVVLTWDMSCSCEAMISLVGWIGGMPGRIDAAAMTSSSLILDDSLDCLFERGIGRDVPKLLRDPRRSLEDGAELKGCMRSFVSAKGERDIGTSMVFLSLLSSGTESMRRNIGRSTFLSGVLSACLLGEVGAPGILKDLVDSGCEEVAKRCLW